MKNILSLFCVLASVAACAAEATISDVVVRQRLPWNAKVDIDFTVCGTNCNVDVMARYDGVEPFSLMGNGLSGDFLNVAPGAGHIVWDPVKAGHGDAPLRDFRVTLTPSAATSRDYLIVDLQTGDCSYTGEVPAEGWIEAENGAYYTTKMVFRRVPKGTFQMGYDKDQRNFLNTFVTDKDGTNIVTAGRAQARQITLSHDCYISIFKTTVGQFLCLTGTVAKTLSAPPAATLANRYFVKSTYNALRGSKDQGIDWPNTEGDLYKVAPDSAIAGFRSLVGDRLPEDWIIDLPTAAQWERMAKSGAPDSWIVSNYGDPPYSGEGMTNALNQTDTWKVHYKSSGTNAVGYWEPTPWGFYDVCGLNYEWNLDWVPGSAPKNETDPVGPSTGQNGCRYRRCWNYTEAGHGLTIPYLIPGIAGTYGPDSANPSFRFCIHTHRLSK